AADDPGGCVEVLGEQLPDVLRIAGLREGGEPDQVGEHDRHEPPLGGRGPTKGAGFGGGRGGDLAKEGAALTAELRGRGVGCGAGRAGPCQRRAALYTELAAALVLGAAHRTAHEASLIGVSGWVGARESL